MLNIPETVKTLFKQDGVHKNFRAHFSNGELPDLTNENIVQESVKFTESVCSQDVFKFGLTEASTIEFETVGVANMYGMAIECSCEIDCSSLSAADKADIAAGTWDGTWDSVNEVFAVPYGTFRVESCPRDHQAMAHRRVTAYTDRMDGTNQFEEDKSALLLAIGKEKYTPFLPSFVLAQICKTPESIVRNGYTATVLTPSEFDPWGPMWSRTISAKDSGGNDATVVFSVYGKYNTFMSANMRERRTFLASVEYGDFDDEADFAVAENILANIDAQASGYSTLSEMVRENLPPTFMPIVLYGTNARILVALESFDGYVAPKSGEVFYPYRPYYNLGFGSSQYPQAISFWSMVSASISINGNSTNIFDGRTPGSFTIYEPPTADEPIKLSFDPTLKARKQFAYGKYNASSFSDAFSVGKIVQGYLELTAQFATADRTGGNKIIRIDNTSPVPVAPGEYRQMWFDEYNVEPIGTIRYAYTDEAGEEQVVDYRFGDGASIYDMTDNEVLKLMDGADPAVIEALLDASFIPNLAPVNFVPIDLSMKGFPYIEAGDALSVTAQDGTVCASYALRHEISGIQALEAQIDSQSGLIIESEAAT